MSSVSSCFLGATFWHTLYNYYQCFILLLVLFQIAKTTTISEFSDRFDRFWSPIRVARDADTAETVSVSQKSNSRKSILF